MRTPDELELCAGLVLPGGESTTIGKLLASSGLDEALGEYQGQLARHLRGHDRARQGGQ